VRHRRAIHAGTLLRVVQITPGSPAKVRKKILTAEGVSDAERVVQKMCEVLIALPLAMGGTYIDWRCPDSPKRVLCEAVGGRCRRSYDEVKGAASPLVLRVSSL
jgi:hypothetical protein